MLRLRPYKPCDADTILTWCENETTFRNWTGTQYGDYPITASDMNRKYFDGNGDCAEPDNFFPMTAFDHRGLAGHLILRFTDPDKTALRFGFVIVDAARRGTGCGKEMLRLALQYAFEILKVECVTIGVFEDNAPAFFCYRSVGFRELGPEHIHTVTVNGQQRKIVNLEMTKYIYAKGENGYGKRTAQDL